MHVEAEMNVFFFSPSFLYTQLGCDTRFLHLTFSVKQRISDIIQHKPLGGFPALCLVAVQSSGVGMTLTYLSNPQLLNSEGVSSLSLPLTALR